MAHVVNVSGDRFVLEIGIGPGRPPELIELQAGEATNLPDAYATRRAPAEGRDSIASVVEQLTGGKVLPANDPRAAHVYAAWQEARAAVAAKATSPAPSGKAR